MTSDGWLAVIGGVAGLGSAGISSMVAHLVAKSWMERRRTHRQRRSDAVTVIGPVVR